MKDQLINNVWKELNAKGIFTEEQLDEAIKKQLPLDLTLFFTPVPGLPEEKIKELEKMASKYKVVVNSKMRNAALNKSSTA